MHPLILAVPADLIPSAPAWGDLVGVAVVGKALVAAIWAAATLYAVGRLAWGAGTAAYARSGGNAIQMDEGRQKLISGGIAVAVCAGLYPLVQIVWGMGESIS